MKREFYIKEIIEEFSILKNKLELLSEINLHDMNIISEYHIQEILNIIFDLKLKNSNSLKNNSTAIDLEDDENSIAVQVTSTSKKNKIQDTLDKFFIYNLDAKFEVLLIFILGKRQKDYKNLKVKEGFKFDSNEQIIDFAKIISRLSTLSSLKIEKIRNILKNDRLPQGKNENPVTRFKKNLSIKKDISSKLFIKNLSIKDREFLYYAPYRSFIYDSLIIRSIEDIAYPNIDDDERNPISTWYKAQIHDTYEYGIEIMITSSFDIVVNSKGEWDYLNYRNIEKLPSEIKYIRASILQRIPFDYMVELDMNTDPVYGYPTLFLEYKNDKKPFSEEIPFLIGYYNDNKDFRKVYYFELSDKNENI